MARHLERTMDLNPTPQERQFRDELRDWRRQVYEGAWAGPS